jgi:hypothetical protein
MPSKTRAQDGAGTSRGREATPNPPLVPPTLVEAIAALVNATADNTRFLREMAGQQMQQQGGRAYQQGPCRRFETGGSLSRRVSVLRAPAQMGRARGRARRGERRGGRSRA